MSDLMSETSPSRGNNNDTSDTLSQRICPVSRYDCRDGQFEESSLQEHYRSEKHQKTLVRCTQQLIESKDGGSSEADTDIEEGSTLLLENHYNRLSIMTKDITTNDNELTRLDDGIFQCNNQMTIFSEQLNDAQTELSLEKAQIDAISTNQNTLKQDVTTLKQQIENDNKIVKQEPDGTMVWKITNVREKMYDAQSERQTSVYSPPFYTSISGYKVCVRLYLNGDGSARGTYMSVFLVILRGPYDSLLKWPFSYRVSFCLYDQRTIIEKNGKMQPKHIIESFRPDTNSISFKQPCSAMNIASGIPKFCPLSEISELTNDNLYIVNDTMYIKTLIDFVEMPRSMLPFIFNINIAFPLHIQQKLISDEMKRLDEQNNN